LDPSAQAEAAKKQKGDPLQNRPLIFVLLENKDPAKCPKSNDLG
jgi:predicted nucleic acid binding AN1-type Zn finger protein